MGALLTIIPMWGRLLFIALLSVALIGFGFVKGNEHGTQKLISYQAAQTVQATHIAAAREVVTTKVVNHYITVKGKTETATKAVAKEVTEYAKTDTGVCLTASWRVLHDEAAAAAIPETRQQPDATGGTPTAAEALSTVTDNYARCNRTADRLDAVQAWIVEQEKVKLK